MRWVRIWKQHPVIYTHFPGIIASVSFLPALFSPPLCDFFFYSFPSHLSSCHILSLSSLCLFLNNFSIFITIYLLHFPLACKGLCKKKQWNIMIKCTWAWVLPLLWCSAVWLWVRYLIPNFLPPICKLKLQNKPHKTNWILKIITLVHCLF